MPLNHNIFNRRTYTVAATVLIVVLSFILFRECTPKEDNTGYQLALDMHKQVKHENDSIKVELKRIQASRDSLEIFNAELKDDLYLYQRSIIQSSGDIRSLSIRLDNARKDKDTVKYVESCDSLQTVANDQQGILEHLSVTTDAMISNYDQQIAKADSANDALISINNKLESGYNYAIEETKKQNQEKERATKQLKREKTKTRILAGVVIATIVYSIIPK